MFKKGNLGHFLLLVKELIIAATVDEIQPFIKEVAPKKTPRIGEVIVLNSHVNLLITGVGIGVSMVQVSMALHAERYNSILQLGFGGSFSDLIQIGALVRVVSDCFGDIGIDDLGHFYPLHQMLNQYLPDNYPADGRLSDEMMVQSANHWATCSNILNLTECTAVTVATSSGSKERIAMIRNSWNPEVESMEGAAVWLLCVAHQIPFMQIRCISNQVAPRDLSSWQIPRCASILSNWLLNYLKERHDY